MKLNNNLAIAVIGNGEVIAASPAGIERRPYPTDYIAHVSGLAAIALTEALPLRAIWIDPSDPTLTAASQQPAFWESLGGCHVWATGVAGAGVPSSAQVRRDNGTGAQRREVSIFADLPRRWGLECAGPTLANVIRHYEQAMTVDARYSPAQTALALLAKQSNMPSRAGWLTPLSDSMYHALPFPSMVAPLHVNPIPRNGRYIHMYDKNAAYMAAAKHGLGAGDPTYIPSIDTDLAIRVSQGKVYGLWCISAWPPTKPSNTIPDPFMGDQQPVEEHWVYSPQISLAAQLGWKILFHEGYHWPNYHTVCCDWADHLWAARQQVKGSITEGLIKRSFNQARGVMARPVAPGGRVQWYHRPDWSAVMAAEHYLRQVKQIDAFETKQPGYLCCNTDSIAWTSDDPDPATALPGILDRRDGLGGYKHSGTIAGEAAQTIITQARMGATITTLASAMRAAIAEASDAHVSSQP